MPHRPVQPASATSRYTVWVVAAVITTAVIVAFAPGLRTPFQYDDLSTVVENESIRSLSSIGTVLSPPPNQAPTSGRPLLNLSFAIDYAIGGSNVVTYHATNITLHIVCALLLFTIVRTTMSLLSVRPGSRADIVAAMVTAIWAVHPLHTGTVTYISGRSDSLMAVCYFAALLAAIRAHDSPQRRKWTAAAIAASALGMVCKESMATAPLAILLYDRAYVYQGFAQAFRQRWRLYAGLAATWTILVALLLEAPHSESAGFSAGVSTWTYLLNQAVVIPHYLRQTMWPDHILFAYGEAQEISLADVGALAIVVPALLAASAWMWVRRPALGFCAIWVFLTLAPTSSIVPIATEAGAARRMYLPLAGLVVLFVLAMYALVDRLHHRRAASTTWMPAAAAAAIAVVLASATAAQSAQFASAERLWRSSAERWPSALAHRNLAGVLLQQGRRAEGAEALRAAAERNPVARYALGVQLFELGRRAEAIGELQRAIRELPGHPSAQEGRRVLARALREEGRHAEAADVFADVAASTPDDITPMLARADELLAAGNLDAAHREYQRVLARDPAHAGAMTNDALTLLRMGRVADAIPLLQLLSERQPDNVSAYMNLASAFAAAGRFVAAAESACRAVRIDPRHPAPRQFLAELRRAGAPVGSCDR